MARKMLLLDIDAILNKQFNIDFKGYSPVEVDQFLDSVVRDYDSYEKMLSEVSDEAEHLKNVTGRHPAQNCQTGTGSLQ